MKFVIQFSTNEGYFWRAKLSGCATCETELTVPGGVSKNCAIDKNGINNCKLTCDSGEDFLLGNKTPKTIAVKCKCPRDKKTKVKHFHQQKSSEIRINKPVQIKVFSRSELVVGSAAEWVGSSSKQMLQR